MEDLVFRVAGPLHDGVGLLFSLSGLALELGDGRDLVAGLGVGPVGTCHAFFCHTKYLLFSCGGGDGAGRWVLTGRMVSLAGGKPAGALIEWSGSLFPEASRR